jgi:hypothetical protein
MNKAKLVGFICAGVFMLLIAAYGSAYSETPLSILKAYGNYASSEFCRNCHNNIFEQHSESIHAGAFSNPLFRAQYFKEVLPQAEKTRELYEEAKKCVACHSPIDYIVREGRVFSEADVDPRTAGVTCDICHIIKGYTGNEPGNGNYITAEGGGEKRGPFQHEYNWHRDYSKLQTTSEFCGICHNAVNRAGLEVKSTYTEWKESRYAMEGIQCQDCHMNMIGMLINDKPVYEAGRAAEPPYAFMRKPPYRSILYTHSFPGAHSNSQMGGGIMKVTIEADKTTASPGDVLRIDVLVDNSKTGHKMPSGSKELRQLWLELSAINGEKVIRIPASSTAEGSFDVSGMGRFDREILADDIPEGSRIYRTVFLDEEGKQTLNFYNAVKVAFDNRLAASEIRKESYSFTIPKDAKGKIALRASLTYLQYPTSFSGRFGLPQPERFEIATVLKEVLIR